MSGQHATAHLAPLGDEDVAKPVNQKFFQIPDIGDYPSLFLQGQIRCHSALYCRMDLRRAHTQVNGQAIVGPLLLTYGNQLQ